MHDYDAIPCLDEVAVTAQWSWRAREEAAEQARRWEAAASAAAEQAAEWALIAHIDRVRKEAVAARADQWATAMEAAADWTGPTT